MKAFNGIRLYLTRINVRAMRDLLSGNRGFTLVEILLAVAVLGIVAAIAFPAVANIRSRSETKAEASELDNIQAAIDALMSDQELDVLPTVTAAGATNNLDAFPSATTPLYGDVTYGDYMRNLTAKCNYSVTANGRVAQESCP